MLKRHLKSLILESLKYFPVAAILGPRQVGKSTLAQNLLSKQWPAKYYSLDDFSLLSAATRDPDGFIEGLDQPAVLDEIQRAPGLLRSIKRTVDQNRKPGLFLLTGSANLMTLRKVSESLAGRIALFQLHPFSWSELSRHAVPPDTLENLFASPDTKTFLKLFASSETRRPRNKLAENILAGGYPAPALMKPGRIRSQWFDSYRQTYLERDLREIVHILNLSDYGRLLIAAAARTGQLLNMAEISRQLGIPLNTLKRYIGLLETTYQIWTLPPYYANINKRLIKTPKLYFNDTGLAASLMAFEDWAMFEKQGHAGALVETWVANELRKLIALSSRRTDLFFWRTHAGREVDFILARGGRLIAIEVKWSQSLRGTDLAGLENCRNDLKKQLGLSVILYTGQKVLALNDHMVAIPILMFFE